MAHTILLADDSPTIQRLVAQIFEGDQFKVVPVGNGDAAIRTFDETRPALVLADIFMPGKSGYEVCSWVKAHPVLGRTPVVLLVGAYEAFDPEEARRVGADGLVKKPFEPQELFDLATSMIAEPPPEAGGADTGHEDLLGLSDLFPQAEADAGRAELSAIEIDAIADRVIQRLSAEVIEGIAWEVVPDIAGRVVHEELKKHRED